LTTGDCPNAPAVQVSAANSEAASIDFFIFSAPLLG
jgi:hypothetical protein